MCKLLLLGIAPACLALAAPIQYASVSGTLMGPSIELWTEVTFETQPLNRDAGPGGEQWAGHDYQEVYASLGLPALLLPPGAVLLGQSLYLEGAEDYQFLPTTRTVAASPVVADCDGIPCPYSPAEFQYLAGYLWTTGIQRLYTLDELRAGPVVDVMWILGFYGDARRLDNGFNAVTTTRWSFTHKPSTDVSVIVWYEATAIPEPGAVWLCAAGLSLGMLARKRAAAARPPCRR